MNKKGFTLVETVIAALIMGISVFAITTALYSQVNALNQNREKTIAALAAQEEIENIRGKPFDNISSHTFDVAEAPGLTYLRMPPDAAKRGNVDVVNNACGANTKKVVVTVTWASMNDRILQTKLGTIIARNGIDKQ